MFERFTPDARRVIVVAQELSRARGGPYIEIDDIARAVLGLPSTLGCELLVSFDVDPVATTEAIRAGQPTGSKRPEGHIPFALDVKAMLERAVRGAFTLHDSHIGTEHLTWGILATGGSRAWKAIGERGVDSDRYWAALAARTDRASAGSAAGDAAHLEQAHRLLLAHDGPAALAEADLALADAERSGQQPHLAHAQNLVAWLVALQVQAGRYDEALDLIHRALAARPAEEALQGTRWSLLAVMGRGADAVAGLEHVLTLGDDVLGPERGVSHTFLGRALLDAGDRDGARAQAREADRFGAPWPVQQDLWRRIDELDGTWLPPG